MTTCGLSHIRSAAAATLGLIGMVSIAPAQAEGGDLLDLASGSVVHSASSEYETDWQVDWTAIAVLDGSAKRGWSSAQGAPFPHQITIELPAIYDLETVTLDNSGVESFQPKGISAREVELAGSLEGATTGFRTIGAGEVEQSGRTTLSLEAPARLRWLRVSINSNWGHPEYTELMELEATGTLATELEPRGAAGVYETDYGEMIIKEKDGQLTGCYGDGLGRLSGQVSGRGFRVEWRQDQDRGAGRTGAAIMAISDDGVLNGIWSGRGRHADLRGRWFGHRKAGDGTSSCEDQDLLEDLGALGRVVLYGIRFETNSAVLRADAEPTLKEILAALNTDPELRLVIEGHTDSTASDAYNLELSNKRSAAVVGWLRERGISDSRISAIGKGESQPVADNTTAQGRLLNRRVEVVVDR